MSKSPILFSSDDEEEESHQEVKVLKKFQSMLQGVPPPVSVTMSKLSVTDMLSKYKENESSYALMPQEPNTQKSSKKVNTTPLVYYLNSSQTSEDIANLYLKVQSRYIYSETLSSCNVWFNSSIKVSSAKKCSGNRNGFRISPGSRLSHLARRRQIFSCENLQQLGNSERRRHIEIKDSNALRNKNSAKNDTIEFEKLNSSKRALFQSPEADEPKKMILSNNSIKRNLFPSSGKRKIIGDNSKNFETSKWLSQQSFSMGSSKKRKRLESREGNENWPRRALTFTDESSNQSQEDNSRNSKVISELQLSLHHKSKLLWAVSVTLKEKNMTSKDPQFKTCAAALFMICRKNLGKILNSKVEGGTSEKMLCFAREQIGGIFQKLGITRDNNDNSSSEKVEVLGSKNDASLVGCSEEAQVDAEKSSNENEAVCSSENQMSCGVSESPSNSLNDTVNVNVTVSEKENIDVCENVECYT